MLYLKLTLMAIFWSGVFPAVNIVLQSMGLFASVFLRFTAAAVILIALLRLREQRMPRLSPRESVLVLVLGALWVLSRGDPAALAALDFGLGEGVLVACIFIWSAYTLLGRVALSTLSPLALTAYVMAVGSVPLAVPAWLEHETLARVTWQGWAALGYLAVFGTVIPFLWFYEGVKALGAARASQFINLVPPIAVLASVLLLDESLTPGLYVGMALVVVGLYLTNRPR